MPSLRYLLILLAIFLPVAAQAGSTESLAQAHKELGADHIYAADALFEEVIKDEDATSLQVQEALFMQSLIYYGDVIGSMTVIQPLASASQEGSGYKQKVSKQLLLARRAFHASASRFLTATVAGSNLKEIRTSLPPFSEQDYRLINQTLADASQLQSILTEYETDSSAGLGLLLKSNRLGMYIGFGRMLPPNTSQKIDDVRSQYAQGVSFSQLTYFDFLAEVALEMFKLVDEPGGPNLLDLARRADQRIMDIAGDNTQNLYVKNAGKRKSQYLGL